jgi:hypothetical protein
MKTFIALLCCLSLAGCTWLAEQRAECRADPHCQAQLAAASAQAARNEQRMNELSEDQDRQRANFNAYMQDRGAASDAIVSNAAARNAQDVAAAAPRAPVQLPSRSRQPVDDPLAPNSAMRAEAAQARKGTGTDLCPNTISDTECANRVNALQEQARGQH